MYIFHASISDIFACRNLHSLLTGGEHQMDQSSLEGTHQFLCILNTCLRVCVKTIINFEIFLDYINKLFMAYVAGQSFCSMVANNMMCV